MFAPEGTESVRLAELSAHGAHRRGADLVRPGLASGARPRPAPDAHDRRIELVEGRRLHLGRDLGPEAALRDGRVHDDEPVRAPHGLDDRLEVQRYERARIDHLGVDPSSARPAPRPAPRPRAAPAPRSSRRCPAAAPSRCRAGPAAPAPGGPRDRSGRPGRGRRSPRPAGRLRPRAGRASRPSARGRPPARPRPAACASPAGPTAARRRSREPRRPGRRPSIDRSTTGRMPDWAAPIATPQRVLAETGAGRVPRRARTRAGRRAGRRLAGAPAKVSCSESPAVGAGLSRADWTAPSTARRDSSSIEPASSSTTTPPRRRGAGSGGSASAPLLPRERHSSRSGPRPARAYASRGAKDSQTATASLPSTLWVRRPWWARASSRSRPPPFSHTRITGSPQSAARPASRRPSAVRLRSSTNATATWSSPRSFAASALPAATARSPPVDHQPVLDVDEVPGSAESPAEPADPPHQLGHRRRQLAAGRQRLPVRAPAAVDRVVVAQLPADACRHGLAARSSSPALSSKAWISHIVRRRSSASSQSRVGPVLSGDGLELGGGGHIRELVRILRRPLGCGSAFSRAAPGARARDGGRPSTEHGREQRQGQPGAGGAGPS